MKKFFNNIIAMVIALSISAVTANAQDGMCNDFRTGTNYTRQMTKQEFITEYLNDEFKMSELITLLQWHNVFRGWGLGEITREDAIAFLEGCDIKKASGEMNVARNCDGNVKWFTRLPKTRFGGEEILHRVVRGEDIEIASLDCANLLWSKHGIPNETPLVETTTDTATSKGGNASAVATATASVGDINITVPPTEDNDSYNGGYGSQSVGSMYGFTGGYNYNPYYYDPCYGYGMGAYAGFGIGPLGFTAYAGIGSYGYGNCGSCGGNNFTPSSYINNYYTNNYYGDDDDGDINIFIDNNNTNNNNNYNWIHTTTVDQKEPPVVDDGGPVDPPSGFDENGNPVDPIDPGTTTGDGTDPGSGNDPVDPGSGKTDETTAQHVESFKGSFETKSLSVNTNEKVTSQQQLSGKKSFETGPSALAMNSKINGMNNEVFAKQTQLENYTKSFQTETASKTANQTLRSSDTQSKTLKEFSAMALQNKQVSNGQQNMSLAAKTASVRSDVNQKNGQQTFQNNMSARGNEGLQKSFNANNGQNYRVDNGNNFQRSENFGLSKRTGNQNPAPRMNVNQQQNQRQNVAPAPRMQNGAGNMRVQQAPPMMRSQNMGLTKR